jgi:23S rRNA (guanine2445-N2)-methyltransferase / 23S rRNA (guanine2069-N7)-methyltransferase
MQQTLDVQRDHVELVRRSMALLKHDGLLLFSTNRRGFKLAAELQAEFAVTDITQATVCEDFKRNARIHQCWEIRHADGQGGSA